MNPVQFTLGQYESAINSLLNLNEQILCADLQNKFNIAGFSQTTTLITVSTVTNILGGMNRRITIEPTGSLACQAYKNAIKGYPNTPINKLNLINELYGIMSNAPGQQQQVNVINTTLLQANKITIDFTINSNSALLYELEDLAYFLRIANIIYSFIECIFKKFKCC